MSVVMTTALLVICASVLMAILMHLYLTHPANGVLVEGMPKLYHKKLETAAGVIPGVLVATGTLDHQVIACTASLKPTGWAGYEFCKPGNQPANRDTVYVVDKWIPIYYGGNFKVLGFLASGNNGVEGDHVKPAAAGKLALRTHALTTLAGSTAVTSTLANGANIGGDEGSYDVGILQENKDASAADKRAMVLSLI